MLRFIVRLFVDTTLTFVSYSLSSSNECHQADDVTQVTVGNFQKLLPVQEVVVNNIQHKLFVCVRVRVCVFVCVRVCALLPAAEGV